MYERSYHCINRLTKEYFMLLCGVANLHGTYDCFPEEPRPGKGETYRITLSGYETYKVMQKVLDAYHG
jgi:hypothetical protein